MNTIYVNNNTIYESPDGGRTVYAREIQSTERTLVYENMPIRIDPLKGIKYSMSYADFITIMQMSETNPTLRDCVDKMLSTYNLLKMHG